MDQTTPLTRYSAHNDAMTFDPLNPWKAADTNAMNKLVKATIRKEYEDYIQQNNRLISFLRINPKRQKT